MLRTAPNRIWTLIALLAIFSTPAVDSQTPQLPHFDAATIRPGGDIMSTKPQSSPGRFLWTTQLSYLIGYAYDLESNRVSGKGTEVVYTINAVFAPNTTDDELRRILQSLLVERFNMRFHRQVREVDGFAVNVGKGSVKMIESATASQADHNGSSSGRPSAPIDESYLGATMTSRGVISINAHEASLAQLTRALERCEGKPFWDQTGLQGKYDFTFTFSQDPDVDLPSLPTALQQTLDLTLHKQRGPLEALVVDHLAPPSEN
jgi:uncharacterized protein (TIGR03435 family)